MKEHKLSGLMPAMTEQEFRDLVADIKVKKQFDPIITYKGQILDGRHRYRACMELGIEPLTEEFQGSEAEATALVISLNLKRRHLTDTQRAVIAASMATRKRGMHNQNHSVNSSQDGANGPDGPFTTGQAASLLSVSEKSVKRAKKVREKAGKEVRKALDEGAISLAKAAEIADAPKAEQPALLKSRYVAADPCPFTPENDHSALLERVKAIEGEWWALNCTNGFHRATAISFGKYLVEKL